MISERPDTVQHCRKSSPGVLAGETDYYAYPYVCFDLVHHSLGKVGIGRDNITVKGPGGRGLPGHLICTTLL